MNTAYTSRTDARQTYHARSRKVVDGTGRRALAKGKPSAHQQDIVQRPGSDERWTILLSEATGAIMGIFPATLHHLLHDHPALTAEELLWHHFIPEMLATMVGSAIVFATVAAIRNGLKRRS